MVRKRKSEEKKMMKERSGKNTSKVPRTGNGGGEGEKEKGGRGVKENGETPHKGVRSSLTFAWRSPPLPLPSPPQRLSASDKAAVATIAAAAAAAVPATPCSGRHALQIPAGDPTALGEVTGLTATAPPQDYTGMQL